MGIHYSTSSGKKTIIRYTKDNGQGAASLTDLGENYLDPGLRGGYFQETIRVGQVFKRGVDLFKSSRLLVAYFDVVSDGKCESVIPSEEFKLTANSLGAHIETYNGLILMTFN